jgi:hypothetical protein
MKKSPEWALSSVWSVKDEAESNPDTKESADLQPKVRARHGCSK